MLELRRDQLQFTFNEVHPSAQLTLSFQRTLRIPDDDRSYPLPPGLGCFPLRHVDDFAAQLPADWQRRGGVMLPMWQAEAMWLSIRAGYDSDRGVDYPFALKVAAGKRSAVTGKAWHSGLNREPQDYLVAPTQPWLDGFCVEKGLIRQFVAMPLGQGYSVEEQLDGKAEFGGLQLEVFPMKRSVFERRFPVRPPRDEYFSDLAVPCAPMMPCAAAPGMAMGLAAGGKMRQEISVDPYELDDWDLEHGQRCFVHLCNSAVWQQVTGTAPPTLPPSAKDYSQAGLPWFEYYSDAPAVEGGKLLSAIKSVFQLGKDKGQTPLPENAPAVPKVVVGLEPRKSDQVRVGEF